MASTTETLLKTFLDSGAPQDSTDYTTVVIIHGWGFHAANLKKLLPLAHKYNARVVLPNRRDYPGSAPFTPEELENLSKLANANPGSSDAVEGTEQEMKARAREVYDYLVDLVKTEHIPPAQGHQGGIVLVGWSLGATWISALLAHVATFPVEDIRLSEYVRRLVYYDASYLGLGFPFPEGLYHPLHDPSLPMEEYFEKFCTWSSSYFAHGDLGAGLHALEDRNALESPPPTVKTMSVEELAESTSAAGEPGGSESLLAQACGIHGVFASLRKQAFFLRDIPDGADDWRSVELRLIWCDHSFWEMPLLAWTFPKELEEAAKAGQKVRTVNFVRFRGANHFAHWDLPEKTLAGILSDETEI
ncbi:Alpha/Beta hydrolase protein [Dichomitus squalens]|uniref:Alpha/Beta hydrolase protein n=1 Tax=Dichomitus squalens TaxID=114155 RepID=A0A4Q9MRW6_9APHY|nr:Alpha/Beta hydrolase protein [Dichomitus squalens]